MRAVVFDLDGLLIDSEPLWGCVLRAAQGGRYDPAVHERHKGMRLADVVAVIERELGLHLDGDAILDALLCEFDRSLVPMPGAAHALALTERYPRAIASGSPLRLIRWVVRRFHWRFDALCSGDEVARGKPSPDLFLLAAGRLGVAPDACVALEDSENGIRAARAAGMRCLAVPGTLNSLAELRDEHL